MFDKLPRFKEKVDIQGPDDCWEWQAGKVSGYGQFWLNGKHRLSHRVAWELATGEDPGELCVLHGCDNPACCNPDHLFLGTYVDNARDMQEKGRKASTSGERHGRAKLTEDQVRKIRDSNKTQVALASEYGVSQSLVGRIKLRQAWAHV